MSGKRKSRSAAARVAQLAATLPEPPWRRSPARESARRGPLGREAIVAAALRVLDREGIDGVSMRGVATELGTGPASLYWHVRGKEELLDLLVDHVMGELRVPEPDPARWREQLLAFAREQRRVLLGHRDLARVMLGRVPVGPAFVVILEGMLAILRGAGIPDRLALYFGDLAALYVNAFVYEEVLDRWAPAGVDGTVEDTLREMADYLRSLPRERFPNVADVADEIFAPGAVGDRFELGLQLLIAGLVAQAHAAGARVR